MATTGIQTPSPSLRPIPDTRNDEAAGLPVSFPIDPTPYGIAVYEVSRQRNTSLEPAPAEKTVRPTPPAEKPGFLNFLLPSPKWGKRRESGPHIYIPQDQLHEEEILRKIISHFNNQQTRRRRPVHLVLAENRGELALDIYDCSSGDLCKLVYDTPLERSTLPELQEKLRQETGVFVDTVM